MRVHVGVLVAIAMNVLGCVCWAETALAQKRVALVIGNSAYTNTSALTNPKNDATDIAAALNKHGFQVIEGFDLDKAAFDRKVRDFANALSGAAVGLFFYAGHGLSVAGQNYLVPVDAQLTTPVALEFEMVRVDTVHRVMELQASTNILFLDACRDNPLARNLARSMGTRSTDISKGLAAVESGVGTLISFSTQPGNLALDGAGRNSPFAGALAKHLSSTNDDLGAILIAVRNDVMKETQRKQVPWEHSALTGRFYFAPQAAPSVVSPPRSNADEWILLNDGPVSELFLQSDLERIKQILTKKSMPLPDFQIRTPTDKVPEKLRRFVGVWISNAGWGGVGRQYMIIITNIDDQGRVIGHISRGPPTAESFVQSPANHFQFSGLISGDRLTIRFSSSSMWATFNSKNNLDVREQFNDGRSSSITLERAWTLVETEKATRR